MSSTKRTARDGLSRDITSPDASSLAKRDSSRVGPKNRKDVVRLLDDAMFRVRDGHPWVYREALLGRRLEAPVGAPIRLVDRNGNFLAWALSDQDSNLVLRVHSRRDSAGPRPDCPMVVQRALDFRKDYPFANDGGAYRLLSGDCEGFPATNIDYYAGYIVVSIYSPVVLPYIKDLVSALNDKLSPKAIYVQHRVRARPEGKALPPSRLAAGIAPKGLVHIEEAGMKIAVDVSAPLGTGFFNDMRVARDWLRQWLRTRPDAAILNTFSYTGAFSVLAAMNAARSVVSVDIAASAHERAITNFKLNGLDPEQHVFETMDAFASMTRRQQRGELFDLVILDPPTYATNRDGKKRSFTALKDYAELVKTAVDVTKDSGYILAATNAVKFSRADFEKAIGRAASQKGVSLSIVRHIPLPEDYPLIPSFAEANYLKVLLLKLTR